MKKNQMLVPVIVTLSLIGWLCPAACQPAMIPSDSYFVDHYVITQTSVFAGTYAQSAFNASAVRRTAGTISRLPVHEDLWLLKGAFYMYLNGVCRDLPVPIPSTYIPSFSWMASSSLLQNSSKANGVPCQLWGLTVSNVSIETCLAFNPDPAYAYPVRQTIRFLASTAPPTVQDYFGFHPVSDPNQFPPAIFDLPSLCTSDGIICPEGPVITLDLYNLHDRSVVDIGNQNMASSVGEAFYLCGVVAGTRQLGTPPGDSFVTAWRMLVNSTWGQYQQCNPLGPGQMWICTGGNPSLVGREAPDDLVAPIGGQCLTDEQLAHTGVWYSFPNTSRCETSGQVGSTCKWYPLQQLNSVSFECLLSAGVADTCRQDDGFPYAATSALLDALLAAPSPSCQPSTLKNERDFIPSPDSGEASQGRASLNINLLPFFF